MKSENGRSMVEMLGVLAIIGVLSVGTISGYSKAMMKYKLNKHTEQMNTLINTVARNVHSFDNIKEGETNLTPYLIKMGEIPTEMVKTNNSDYVYDIFGQEWQIVLQENNIYLTSYHENGSSFLSLSSPDRLPICQNILTIAKEYSDNIYMVSTQTASSDYNEGQFYFIMGNKLCNELKNYRCLKNLALDDTYNICNEHVKGGIAQFYINWER